MKKGFIFSALASLAAALAPVACNKAEEAPLPDGAPMRLVVRAEGSASTKATGITSNDPATEAKVNTLQVFVFDGDALDGYGSSEGSTLATVRCTAGRRNIYALVNAPDLSAVTGRAALLSTVSSLANEVSNFRMIGYRSEELRHDGNVSVSVDRLAARVVLKGIRNSLENAAQAADFTVLSVYLTNVAGDVDWGRSDGYEASEWHNRRGYEPSNSLGSFDYDAVNRAVASGATDGTVHFFYSMPNAAPAVTGVEAGASGYTPRRCRLVIKARIAGSVYNYPILLPAMEGNKSYEINLVNITRPGNLDDGAHDPDDGDDDDEEKPVEGFEQGFEISVNEWGVVLVNGDGNVTI